MIAGPCYVARMRSCRWCALVLATSACGQPAGRAANEALTCASISGALPGTVKLAECSDGRTRELSCERSPAKEADVDIFCACLIGDTMGASFVLFSDSVDAATDSAKAIDVGNRRCGWEVEAPR